MTYQSVRVPNHRTTAPTQISLRLETKTLPSGAFVKVIRPEYLPRDHGLYFNPETDLVVYSQFGLGVVSSESIREA